MISDQDRAAYYQEHKDDPAVWGDAEPAPDAASRTLRLAITLRCSEEEAALIRARAEETSQTYTEVVREAIHNLKRSKIQRQPSKRPTT